MSDLLTGSEVCAIVRVHRSYMPRLIAEGLPHAIIGGRYRVARADLDAWMAARTITAGGDASDEIRGRDVLPAPGRTVAGQGAGRTRRIPDRVRSGRALDKGKMAGATEVGPEDLAFPAKRRREAA